MNQENILISKLNEFTGKYYKNKVVRGILISVGVLLSLFLIEILLEYFSYFPPLARVIMFYFYIAGSFYCLGFFIINPLLKYLRIGRTLSHEQAATIIGKHFADIGDKLLNTLQLIEQKSLGDENIDLLIASIEQRIRAIRPVPFADVIKLRKNVKYLKYALPPLLILLVLLMIAPSIVSEPARRLIHYRNRFSPPSPFRLLILNKELKAMQQDDFTLRVEVAGSEIPEEVFIRTSGSEMGLKRESKFRFNYTFKSLQKETKFTLVADDRETSVYTIEVYPKPIVLNFSASLEYPLYTGKQNEALENVGDFLIPEGTKISWSVFTRDVTDIKFRFSDGDIMLSHNNSNVFRYTRKFLAQTDYSIIQNNNYTTIRDSLYYTIRVIKDAFPEISLSETKDSAGNPRLFFQGIIKDDYGFSKLMFHMSSKSFNDSVFKPLFNEIIRIDTKNPSQVYFYALKLDTLRMAPGDQYGCYFEVWDNDGINGPKSTRSQLFKYEIPTLEQITRAMNSSSENVKKELNKSLSDSKEIKKDLEELSRRMVEQSDVSWKEKKKIEDVIKSNENIQEQVEGIRKKNEENIRNEELYLNTSERIINKQKALNELANQLLTEEMKKMVQEMKNMLNQLDKNKINDLLPKVKEMNENLEKELDRNLQLFKQIDFERKLEQTTNEIKKLAEEQRKLSQENAEKSKEPAKVGEEQNMIQQKYDSLNKSLENLAKIEKDLESQPDINSTKEEREDINNDMKNSEEMIKSGKMKDAAKNQKSTSEKMKDLAQKLDKMQESSDEETQEEDAGALKRLLQSLNKLSFQQENLIYRAMNINRNDPKYLDLVEDQKLVKDKFKPIEDTLTRIARREVMMKSVIMKEVASVNENLVASQKSLSERILPTAMARQQFTMTSMNNLAVLLDEALKQMNENIDNAKMSSGQKACKKPGKPGGKKSMNSMRQMQEQMSKSLEMLKQGQGKSKDGKPRTRSEEEGNSREIAKMVAEQEAIRQAMQEYENALKEKGLKDNGGLNSVIEEMEKNERDVLNRKISQETLNRQQRILTRMLESEKAEEQREKEERRESTEAKNTLLSNPKTNFEYKKNNRAGRDFINFTPVPMNYYYKTKASEYILKIGK